jgi:hypothetical protein
MQKVFPNTGEDFSGYDAARKWCEDNGYSVGSMQAGAPTGVAKGVGIQISKWRNLGEDEELLDGKITGDNFRHGSVTLTLKD